jgi:threonyl-tRNA synthetase
MFDSLASSAAFFLKAALKKCFPHASHFAITHSGGEFGATFTDAAPFQEAYLELLAQTMRTLMQEEVTTKEMLASNAKQYLRHLGQEEEANALEGSGGLVLLAELQGRADRVEAPVEPVSHFALYSFLQKSKTVQITGIACATSKELKSFQKLYKEYPKYTHTVLAKDMELYEEGFWHPRGVALKRAIGEELEKFLVKEKFERVEVNDPEAYRALTGRKKFFQKGDQCFTFEPGALDLVQKWLQKCDLKHRWVFYPGRDKKKNTEITQALQTPQIVPSKGPRAHLQVLFLDGLGREVEGPCLTFYPDYTEFSLVGNLVCFIQILLEQTRGNLPFFLEPEQLRIFLLDDLGLNPLMEILNRYKIRFLIDRSEALLKEKMHRALRLKIPYVMVVGKREIESKEVVIRPRGSDLQERMNYEQLNHFLAELNIASE